MIGEIAIAIAFIFLVFFIPAIPGILIWYLISPIGFFQTFLTVVLCVVIYIPCWVIWLALLVGITEC